MLSKVPLFPLALAINLITSGAFVIGSIVEARLAVQGQQLFTLELYRLHFWVGLFFCLNLALAVPCCLRYGRPALAKVSLIAVILLGALLLADGWVSYLRIDTIGAGSGWCLTHRTWYQKFVNPNERGYWERPLEAFEDSQREDAIVVAAVGDSFTWGQGVPGAQFRFTNVAESQLRANLDSRIRVLQYARGACSPELEAKWIREDVSRVRPKVVMVFYLRNDAPAKPPFEAAGPQFGPLRTALFEIFPSYNYLYWRYLAVADYAPAGQAYFTNLLLAYLLPDVFDRQQQELDKVINSIKSIDAKPVLVFLPFPHMWQSVNRDVRDEIYDRIAERARKNGAEVLELQTLVDDLPVASFSVNPMDGHPNEMVHARIADSVANWLTEHQAWLGSDLSPNHPDLSLLRSDQCENPPAATTQLKKTKRLYCLIGIGISNVVGLAWGAGRWRRRRAATRLISSPAQSVSLNRAA